MVLTHEDLERIGEEYLKHYGVKGMKWGVRNDKGHEGERVKTKKLDKLDKQWEKEMGRSAYVKLYNAAAEKMNNGGVQAINNKPEYKDVDFNDKKNSALYDKYLDEHTKALEKAMVEAGPSLGSNPSGTKRFEIRKNDDGEDDVFLVEVKKKVKHDADDGTLRFRLATNKTGHVTSFTVETDDLKHYGVKGMKWGVRNDSRKGPKLGPSEDKQVAEAARTKAKRSGTSALSNKELRDAAERARLEAEYNRLIGGSTAKTGKKVVLEILANVAKKQATAVANQVAQDQINKAMKKK